MNPALCHPNKKHKALGLCASCWNYDYYHTRTPEMREKQIKWNNEWRKRNPKKIRAWRIRHRWGLSEKEERVIVYSQKKKCPICYAPLKRGKLGRVIDHDHGTGQVRGILCRNCNIGLGWFGDNAVLLTNAAKYLRKQLW